MNDIKLAKDITECEECPLYKHDCPGGWTSGGGGQPIEPPCCSWNDDDEIYEGMYDCDWRDYTDQELEWERRDRERREEKERERKEYLENKIKRYSNYGNTKIKYAGELLDQWLCPRCCHWFLPNGWASPIQNGDGIETAICPICNTKLAHCYELD
jgi:hypothetical protein